MPEQLPARLLVGVLDPEGSWMGASGVAWDVRWNYFTSYGKDKSGWYNNWAGGAPLNDDFVTPWLKEVSQQGFIPGVQYWLLEPDYEPYSTAGVLSKKVQSSDVMNDYFTKFKLLLQAAKQYAKPIIVILEGSALAALEVQANNDPNTYAAIADSGLPELSGLPNTVAGFGLAFLALRKSVGADNVLLGPDVEPSAVGDEVLYHSASDEVGPHVTKQFENYLKPFGVGSNVTGQTFDFLANGPGGLADADHYAIEAGDPGYWWDASDSASINTPSYNRYAEWLRLYNQAAKIPWILWEVPIGNSNSPNLDNNDGAWVGPYPSACVLPPGCNEQSKTGCPGGFKDNRAEYFLGPQRDAHLAKFADAGVIALLFGNCSGCADEKSDYYTDGEPFLKSRAGDLLNNGGFPLSR